MAKWSELQAWAFPQRFLRENLKLGEGGEEGLDNDIARATHERSGASVMGKRMFDAGELAWPEEAPFHTPVFVVTHTRREPWERPGGTTDARYPPDRQDAGSTRSSATGGRSTGAPPAPPARVRTPRRRVQREPVERRAPRLVVGGPAARGAQAEPTGARLAAPGQRPPMQRGFPRGRPPVRLPLVRKGQEQAAPAKVSLDTPDHALQHLTRLACPKVPASRHVPSRASMWRCGISRKSDDVLCTTETAPLCAESTTPALREAA